MHPFFSEIPVSASKRSILHDPILPAVPVHPQCNPFKKKKKKNLVPLWNKITFLSLLVAAKLISSTAMLSVKM